MGWGKWGGGGVWAGSDILLSITDVRTELKRTQSTSFRRSVIGTISNQCKMFCACCTK